MEVDWSVQAGMVTESESWQVESVKLYIVPREVEVVEGTATFSVYRTEKNIQRRRAKLMPMKNTSLTMRERKVTIVVRSC